MCCVVSLCTCGFFVFFLTFLFVCQYYFIFVCLFNMPVYFKREMGGFSMDLERGGEVGKIWEKMRRKNCDQNILLS